MEDIDLLAGELAEVMRIAYIKGITTGGGGNASIRISDGFLITPSGKFKGRLEGKDILMINNRGEVIRGTGKPSSEWRLHLKIYSMREDINSVLHCHHPLATAFSISFRDSLKDIVRDFMTEEASIFLKELTVVPWRPFGTQELADIVSEALKDSNAVLIERHGALVVAEDHWKALAAMESLLETLWIFLFCKILRGIT
ncbi:class II aldolase/adducin family protein [Candidatus Korarchaeum cryptofilum]|uniref:Class II aldolase/adducin family protein n=2 Tax=Candidatus Korarchaeum cryptofilum TaxID=498846 RepID=B1L6D4_KORCO|nr:class II aldolase/adducin family protein [Candidatus Korarchaeum cryptofilum]ACB08013.1 class II aldolase/adducin family protein [Candidatus Korarchaeum cryptofilum OPF8]RSN69656.1 class II aldolase/adducin family protein [Candidatus Korarchaeum cryptofilum]